MPDTDAATSLPPEALLRILEVSRKLATPFDLDALLAEIVAAACSVFRAERATVWLYEEATGELVLARTPGDAPHRVTLEQGLLGRSARTGRIVNVQDCRLESDFDPAADLDLNQDVRSLLSVPLLGEQSLTGVLQVVDKEGGAFTAEDESIAIVLAAQCVVAIERERTLRQLLAAQKLDREIRLAREIQMSTLPAIMPRVPGYDVAGRFVPADQTGGDTFDLVRLGPEQLFMMMGDASGHGIGSALSATQLTAMLRVALRLGASLEDLFRHVNDQLCEDLPEEQFVTAFLGILDAGTHTLRFHSGGQGPLLHYRAASDAIDWLTPSNFPMGFVTYEALGAASSIELAPGDVVALLSDGIYECERADGQQFGTERAGELVRRHATRPMAELLLRMFEATQTFAAGAPQLDDMTVVLLRRLPDD